MLYSNKIKSVKEIEITEEIKYSAIPLGEEGRGRKRYALPSIFNLKKGMNPKLSIGLTKSGKFRIVPSKGSDIYLLIDTEEEYTRKGDGCTFVEYGNVETKTIANGADGEAGRIGSWNVDILKVISKQAIVKCVYGGYKYNPGEYISFIVINNGNIVEITRDNLASYIDTLPESDLVDELMKLLPEK